MKIMEQKYTAKEFARYAELYGNLMVIKQATESCPSGIGYWHRPLVEAISAFEREVPEELRAHEPIRTGVRDLATLAKTCLKDLGMPFSPFSSLVR